MFGSLMYSLADAPGGYTDDACGRWVCLNSGFKTIGSAVSGSDLVGDWTKSLFELFWGTVPEVVMLDQTGAPSDRGANGAEDYLLGKRLVMPSVVDRFLVAASEVVPVGSMGGSNTHNQIPIAIDPVGAAVWVGKTDGDHSVEFLSSGSGGNATQVGANFVQGGVDHRPPFLAAYLFINAGSPVSLGLEMV
jgi:hypothetical protein